METKQDFRIKIRELKKKFSLEEKLKFSESIFKKISSSEIFQKSQTILLYWSLEDEVHTHKFINEWENRKTLLLPAIVNNDLEIRSFKNENTLIKSDNMGIMEPEGDEYRDLESIDLAIIPGMAFDKQNNRMGRGKGYYDRLLPKLTNVYKIGICFSFQLLIEIPVTENDVKMDCIITEQTAI
jgi:5-formyltetrahydrofolate cyclo-ligase